MRGIFGESSHSRDGCVRIPQLSRDNRVELKKERSLDEMEVFGYSSHLVEMRHKNAHSHRRGHANRVRNGEKLAGKRFFPLIV